MYYLKKLAKKFFQYEAILVLKKYKPKIIAITGSVGKTITKEAIYLVMSKRFFVRKSEKSFTTELGIPLTIIGCHNVGSRLQWLENIFRGLLLIVFKTRYPEYLILEIDTDKPGDLQAIYPYLSPDILVVTAIGEVPTHIESFYNIESFIYEKKHIIESVKREGVIIYNADDSRTSNLIQNSLLRKISCGLDKSNTVIGSELHILYGAGKASSTPTGVSFDITHKDGNFPVTVFQTIGLHNEYASLLAFALGVELGLSPKDIALSLNKIPALPGRMHIISGIKDSIIVDDSYNASPLAMTESIIAFTALSCLGKKIVVLGDMLELGRFSAEEHGKIAEMLNNKVDRVLTVGIRSRKIGEELLNLGFDESYIQSFNSAEEAGIELQQIIQANDTIFIKGSQAMRLEKVVEEVMRHPEDKKKILIRQEPEWLTR